MSTFSKIFKINKAQAELDFVDVPIIKDIRLFIDPFAISQRRDPWSLECHRLIKIFFQMIIESIRSGNERKARELLLHLREPNETRFGFSSSRPQGAGIGNLQAQQLYAAIKDSSAVKTGFLHSLEECELMIDGISRDKISDLTTNIIRKKLEEYTISQCDLFNVPVQQVALAPYFSAEQCCWVADYYNLPVHNEKPILLVPKFAARHSMVYDSGKYYNHYILNFLQAETLSAGSSLVRTLKNGKFVVYKKELKNLFPFSKEYLFSFSKNHPDILAKYRNDLEEMEKRGDYVQLESSDDAIMAETLAIALKHVPGGTEAASSYHNLMIGMLEFILFPHLVSPKKEQEIHEGRKRIDIVMENAATSGIFHRLHEIRKMHCPFIPIECKNYTREIANPELDQIAGRFSKERGNVGIVCCRDFEDENRFIKRCVDTFKDGRGLIIHLDDKRVFELLSLIESGRRNSAEDKLTEYFNSVHYS